MNAMNMPGFTAEQSMQPMRGRYRSGGNAAGVSGAVMPAIPRCENCDYILENCANNGGRPYAVCRACASGRCDSSEENPGGHCYIDPISGRRICDI